MQIVKVNTGFGDISIAGDEIFDGHDFYVKANAPLDRIEVVLFFDSRGISGGWPSSIAKMFVEHFQHKNYLVIVRPIDLTTWATLYNFLRINYLQPQLIITNVGIVDFTPKKISLCRLMIDQISFGYDGMMPQIMPIEKYQLSCGNEEMLYSVSYPDQYTKQMNDCFSKFQILAIKTPIVDSNIKISRKRPESFFKQLLKTNEYIDNLSCKSIKTGNFDHRLTYDAVHWTYEGNELIFYRIIDFLNNKILKE